jgi:hypothetical protein
LKIINSIVTVISLTVIWIYPVWSEVCPDDTPGTTVLYVNGIDNDLNKALKSAIETGGKLRNFISNNPIQSGCLKKVGLAYNSNEPFILDFFESANQIIFDKVSQFWLIWANVEAAPDSFQQLAKDIALGIDIGTYGSDSDLQRHVAQYRMEISNGNKVVAVAHSQGNLYANEAHSVLFNGLDGSDPVEEDDFSIVSVATPARFVAGNGPYTTLREDIITFIPSALPPNTTNGSCPLSDIWFCHNFIASYLNGAVSGPQILNHIVGALSAPPPEPEPEIVLQPGPGEGKDIWTTSVFCYCPGGGGPGGGRDDHELVVGGFGDLYYTLIEFDLNGMPAQASSVRLELFPFTQRGVGTISMYLDRITEFWDWRIQGTGSDQERLWWADRPNAVQWLPTALPAPTLGEWYSVDITDLYNAWQDGTHPNYGLQLRPVSTNDRWSEFYSSDYVDDPSLRPKLVVVE